jgi:hypothetical protein
MNQATEQACELVTLRLPVGVTRLRMPAALAALEDFLASFGSEGQLAGCWVPDFGEQNRIVLLRTFRDSRTLLDERKRLLLCANPFLPANLLAGLSFESFVPFPGLPGIGSGSFGPIYEFRAYRLKVGGLAPTMRAWLDILPQRTKLSPLITAMYALDGPSGFVHIWAYPSHEERERVRAEAFRAGVWPARDAPEWLTRELRSECFIPTSISPLR